MKCFLLAVFFELSLRFFYSVLYREGMRIRKRAYSPSWILMYFSVVREAMIFALTYFVAFLVLMKPRLIKFVFWWIFFLKKGKRRSLLYRPVSWKKFVEKESFMLRATLRIGLFVNDEWTIGTGAMVAEVRVAHGIIRRPRRRRRIVAAARRIRRSVSVSHRRHRWAASRMIRCQLSILWFLNFQVFF